MVRFHTKHGHSPQPGDRGRSPAKQYMDNSTPKTIFRWAWRIGFCVYAVATLPLLILFLWNPTCQNTFLNLTAHYRSKIDPVTTVHIGDSITAGGGGHWSTLVGGFPLDAYNLAGNGYTVDQIKHQVSKALAYSPDCICVMGGTNDLFDPRYNADYTIAAYDEMLTDIQAAGVSCIVTLVPYQNSELKRLQIDELNQRIAAIATKHECAVIDLNPLLAPEGILMSEYTTDGTHFSDAAYFIWGSQIERHLRGNAGEPSDAPESPNRAF